MSETGNIQPDVLARALGIDPSVLSIVAAQNAASNFSTLPIGVSGATAGNVFNPETMLLTGAFNPAQFTAAIDSKYNQMLMDYQSKVDRVMQRPYEATLGSIGLDETFYNPSSEIGELMQDAVNSIAVGDQTAAGALDRINSIIDTLPPEVAANIDRISNDLTQFEEKDLPRYRDAVKKYEYDTAQAMANLGITKPTRQDAKLSFYSDLGMPQLALLPDPTDQYDLPIEEFTNKATMERLRGQSTKAMDVLGRVADVGVSPMTQRWQGRANMDIARSAAEKAKQDWLSKNLPKDDRDFISKGLDFAGGSPIIGGLFGGNRRQKEVNQANAKAQEIYNRTYQNKLNELQSNMPTASGYGKETERAARTERFVQKAIARELELAKPKQQQAQAALLSAGITPWQQAMDQLLRNAQAMSTKLK